MPDKPVPKVFGWQHLVYLAIVLVVASVGLVLFKKKARDKAEEIAIKTVGVALLFLIIWNRISIALFKSNPMLIIPDSLCGVTSLGLGICAVVCKRDALPFHFFCYTGLLGGLANVVYPYYVGQDPNFMLPATISGLMHHSLCFILCIMLIMSGYFRPNLKKFYAFPLGLCFCLCYGVFLVDALGVNNVGRYGFVSAMNIYTELVPGVFITSWFFVYPASSLLVLLIAYLCDKIAAERNKHTQ